MFWVALLLLAWAAAGLSCARLCLAALRAAAVEADTAAAEPVTGRDRDHLSGRDRELTLYEAAFLSGGPYRVADLTLVTMARQRRLLLAHTGWATVVDAQGRDDMERSLLGAIGPGGQSRIAPIRSAAAAAEAVRALADRLVAAGLAVPDGARTTVAGAVRQVQAAAVAVAVLGGVALLMPAEQVAQGYRVPIVAWFALPLLLTLGCLAIARFEVHPYTRWASPAGQRLLGNLAPQDGAADDRAYLTTVAVRGIHAVPDPDLRAAFAHGTSDRETTQRGH
ncbi:TIGR04222 domain-containing membrane protein [Streptomyces sp. PSKA54]|uniref:TIGR04222 domain-containing membrane protein n=1 Tax=Streptomyces himalayensis subsp. aureolus TaxID=2758039 RepID=A0A7W2HHV0_9ACTN|nr:TIGR04222 domain-containing membrane protein [Streptomyces himalayensis]MBA4864149.1 TIGR04222 domain-containing membrane protein [Streptomyces himalayensis subsp. aureolus]